MSTSDPLTEEDLGDNLKAFGKSRTVEIVADTATELPEGVVFSEPEVFFASTTPQAAERMGLRYTLENTGDRYFNLLRATGVRCEAFDKTSGALLGNGFGSSLDRASFPLVPGEQRVLECFFTQSFFGPAGTEVELEISIPTFRNGLTTKKIDWVVP